MKFGVVNKSTTVNRCVLHTCKRNITHLAIKTRITNLKLVILKGGTGKEPRIVHLFLLTGFLAVKTSKVIFNSHSYLEIQ